MDNQAAPAFARRRIARKRANRFFRARAGTGRIRKRWERIILKTRPINCNW